MTAPETVERDAEGPQKRGPGTNPCAVGSALSHSCEEGSGTWDSPGGGDGAAGHRPLRHPASSLLRGTEVTS